MDAAVVRHLDDERDFEAFVASHEVALVEFHTTGCPKCAAMEPVLGNVARATGVPVGLYDLGSVPVVERFDIASTPTLILFRNGDPADRLAEGFVGADRLVEFVATVQE